MIFPVVLAVRNITSVVPLDKRKRNITLWSLPLLLMVSVAGGCSSLKSLIATPTLTLSATPTLTSSATPTLTPSPTPTQTPSPTFTPSPTATPVLPVLNGTPYPQPLEVFSSESIDRIQQLSFLSTGWGPQNVVLSGDRRILAIASAAGVHLYNAETLQEFPFLETNNIPPFLNTSRITRGAVLSAALSFDGGLLATGDYSGTIQIWDVENHKLLHTILNGHSDWVNSLAFSPDAHLLVSGGNDSRVIVWDVETGSKIRTLWHRESVYQVAFSPDGSLIFSSSHDATIMLNNVQTGQIVHTFWDTKPVRAMAVSPDGRLIASGSDANTITVWEIASKNKLYTLKGDFNYVFSLAFSSDGRLLASASWDVVKLWNIESGEEIRPSEDRACVTPYTFGYRPASNLLTFLQGDRLLLSGCPEDGTVKIWNVDSGGLEQNWPFGLNNDVASITFSPDGQRVAAGFMEYVMSSVWDANDGRLLHTLSENIHGTNCDGVLGVVFSPDSSRLVSISDCNYGMVRMWDAENGEPLQLLAGSPGATSVAYSPDGHLLAWSKWDITLWDVTKGQEVRTWKAEGYYDHWYSSLAFSPDGRLLATVYYSVTSKVGKPQLLDVESGKLVHAFDAPNISSYSFSPDGRFLLAQIGGQQIKIWELESGNLVQTLIGQSQALSIMAFLPSGELLTRDQCTIKFWQVESGQLLHTFSIPVQLCSDYNIFISPNGRLFLSMSTGNVIRLWGVLP